MRKRENLVDLEKSEKNAPTLAILSNIIKYYNEIYSLSDQGVKPNGLSKRAFSARGDFSGGRAKSDR